MKKNAWTNCIYGLKISTGDGGSALVCSVRGGDSEDSVHYVQVGAVSWGLGCKSTVYPGVYADIQYLTPWILETMKEEDLSTEYFTLNAS